ncbi:glycoside hydrolase family 15 protein [soil metagenome]
MSKPIHEYALIGDCETGALVARDGSIDWLCWPRFDSDACFAALLGDESHGRWLLAPNEPTTMISRSYRGDTLVLDTVFETAKGVVTITDFMPIRGNISDLVRIVQCSSGTIRMTMDLCLRFDYGRTWPWQTRLDNGNLRAIAGPSLVQLKTDAPWTIEEGRIASAFTLVEGEVRSFTLTYSPSHLSLPEPVEAQVALDATLAFWQEWSGQCSVQGSCRETVLRSLITLKALTYRPTGGIVAALTTSLPERLGGERNWDYRFCWLRDATLTLLSLMNCGYLDEAAAWRAWLIRAAAGDPAQLQIMYGLAGERDLFERTLDWLPGFEQSVPVRTGNAAVGQLQLDVFGEVSDALHHGRHFGMELDEEAWALEHSLLLHLEKVWKQPDEGIWEVRGEPRQFTHSKMMAWVAFDRGVKAIETFGVKGPVERWRLIRDEIHAAICQRAWNPTLESFTQSFDGEALDASLLLMPIVGFLPATDFRIVATANAIQQHLFHEGFLVRYDTVHSDDGLSPGEGAFLACNFWLADNLILQGRYTEARDLFERLMALRNDVGLLSEEYDPRTGHMLGNFPQAFSHVGLINTALNLNRHEGPAEQRAES